MRNVPTGPHEPIEGGNWWQRMGWNDECEYAESLVNQCGRCKSVEVLDDFRDEKLCFDCWWSARESVPCFFLKSPDSPLYLGGIHGPTGYTREEADARVLNLQPREYEIIPGDWSDATGRVAHNGYMNRRLRASTSDGSRS